MPYLYCQKHGQALNEKYKDTDWSKYPNEYTKVARGSLLDDFLCDRCNESLSKGDVAYLVGSYPDYYHNTVESEYFDAPVIWIYPKHFQVEGYDDPSLEITELSESSLEHLFDEFR